jgi:prepilin-type N-terminal cleavage/methylation domain-containing protein
MRSQRAFTLAELLVSLIIVGLMFLAIGAIAGPVLRAPQAGSAKSDTVTAAAYGLDGMERDIRRSDPLTVWSCTVAVTTTCSQPSALTVSPYVAMLTPYSSTGTYNSNSVGPIWQAYIVYSQGTGNNIIYRTYQPWVTKPASWQAGAVAAVTAVAALTTGTTVAMPDAQSMSIAVNTQISLQLATAAGTGPAANTTTYTTSILPRN